MNTKLIILGGLLATNMMVSQTTGNLIPNPGFENGTPTIGSIYIVAENVYFTKVQNWRSACDGETGSPDIFDINSSDVNYDIPSSKWAKNVPVRVSGTRRYVGLSSGEPIQCETGGTLEANKNYNLSFYYTPVQRFGVNGTPFTISSNGPAIEVLLRSTTNSCTVQKLIYTSPYATSNNGTWLYNATSFTLSAAEAANNFNRIEFRIKQGTGNLVPVFMDDFSLTRDVSTACFTINNVIGSSQEPSLYGPQTVYKICNDANISINGACSKNEDRYWVGVEKFNLNSWTTSQVIKSGQWICTGCQADYFNLKNFVSPYNFDNNSVYMVSFNVGLDWDTNPSHTIKFFRTTSCKTTGLAEPEEINTELNIYPNPSNGTFHLAFNEMTTSMVEVYDALGNQIIKTQSGDSTIILDLSSYPEGLYFVKATTGDSIRMKKIIKQ